MPVWAKPMLPSIGSSVLVERRSGAIYGIKGSFLFRNLHGHPRFESLLRRMNLA